MRILIKPFYRAVLALLMATLCYPSWLQAETLDFVERIIDGDTLQMKSGKRVRLLGVDSPETHDNRGRNAMTAKWSRVPEKWIDRYAYYAKFFVEDWVEGKPVELRYDAVNAKKEHKDSYGRWLCYVFRSDDSMSLNAALIQEGYAMTFKKFGFAEKKHFLQLEDDAKAKERGFWQYQNAST